MERRQTTPGAARERNREARIGRARQPQLRYPFWAQAGCRIWGDPVAPQASRWSCPERNRSEQRKQNALQ